MSKRLVWVDALRVAVVLLVFAFHSGRVFDTFEMFYAKSAQTSAALSYAVVAFLSVWQMPLLFLLSGMSSYLALGKRSGLQYVRERVTRLLVPFVFGCLVIVPPQGWFGARTNADYAGSFGQFLVDYFSLRWGGISDYLGGPNFGHLWFILHLFLVSVLALPLLLRLRHKAQQGTESRVSAALAKPAWWVVIVFALLLSTALPEVTGHPLWTYLVWFGLGALMARHEALVALARRWRWWLLGGGVALFVPVLLTYDVRERFPDPSLPIALNEYGYQFAGWLLCLAAIGIAVAHLDRPRKWLPYLAGASYPTYILHQTAIVAMGFYLVGAVPEPAISWPLLTVGSIVACYAVYEVLVRRWAPMRFLFGMRPKSRAE